MNFWNSAILSYQAFWNHFRPLEYEEYQEYLLDFRKKILKVLRIALTIIFIAFIIIEFPRKRFEYIPYIIAPLCIFCSLVLNTVFINQRFICYRTKYLSIYLVIVSTILYEMMISQNRSPTMRLELFIFQGIYIGKLEILIFLAKAPFLHIALTSGYFLAYNIIRQIILDRENAFISLPGLIFSTIITVFLQFKLEKLEYDLWLSNRKNKSSLKRFQEVLEIFPNQVIIVDQNSFVLNKPLYVNKEAQKTHSHLFKNDEFRLHRYFSNLLIQGAMPSNENMKIISPPNHRKKFLIEILQESLAEVNYRRKDFKNFLTVFQRHSNSDSNLEESFFKKSSKFETLIGGIRWGDKNALMIIFNDITRREQHRERKKLDKNKDKFLANVSHELRTPLNGLMGMIDEVYDEIPDSKTKIKNCLQTAQSTCKSLRLMINDIIDMLQIQKGILRLSLDKIPLNQSLSKVIQLAEHQIKERGLGFVFENACPLDTLVLADPLRLEQVLINLLTNAIKFTKFGVIKLKIEPLELKRIDSNKWSDGNTISPSSTNSYDSNFKVRISVEDSGIGIEQENIPRLFKLFSKLDTTGNTPGVGLGLAISQGIIKQMDSASINVTSTVGVGSVFSFQLVASPGKLKSIKSHHAHDEPPHYMSSSTFEYILRKSIKQSDIIPQYKILVVDDDHVNQLVLDCYLKSLGDKVQSEKAFNGAEAIEMIKFKAISNEYYNFIIMDSDMPVMNGLEATQKINEMINKKAIPPVYVVAMMANVTVSDKENCLTCGMVDVWTKPITKNEFLNKISPFIAFNK